MLISDAISDTKGVIVMDKTVKQLKAICLTVILCALMVVSVSAETYTRNRIGSFDDFDFEFWMDQGDGEGSMTLNGGGMFTCEWTKTQNILFRTGKKFNETQTHTELGEITFDYDVDYQPDGNSYLCVYGWTVSPLIEFYIVEAWGSWRPPGASPKATVEIDGGAYDIYETTRTNQPSIKGRRTFQQYWSVRTDKKTSGTISVSEHMRAWEKLGMELGKMYEVALCVEGYRSSGYADVLANRLIIGDNTYGAFESAPEEDAEQTTVKPESPDKRLSKFGKFSN